MDMNQSLLTLPTDLNHIDLTLTIKSNEWTYERKHKSCDNIYLSYFTVLSTVTCYKSSNTQCG